MGQSRGGLSTRIHAAVDALGNPVRLLLTPGQQAEIKQAEALIEGFSPGYVIADKGYDAEAFLASIKATEAIALIPPRRHRTVARDYDEYLYGERNQVERLFQKLKHYRRIATRYERLAVTYLAIWIDSHVSNENILHPYSHLITTHTKPSLSNLSGIGGVLSAP